MTLASVARYDPAAVKPIGDRAVVIGASMAGLLATRVLADAYEEVIVIERDELQDEPTVRRGVPQARHPHVLLEAGRATLEDLFPGFGKDLLTAGGLMIDVSTDVHYFDQGDFIADAPTRIPMYCASRPLFEQVVRRRVDAIAGVTIRDSCQFSDYLTDDGVRAVTGIALRDEQDREADLTADVVVDATGRASRTPTWLERNGFDGFDIDWVTIDVVYSTAIIDRPPEDRRVIFVAPDPPRTRGGVAIPVENNQWMILMWGIHGDHPPTDRDGFLDFARSLPVSVFETLLEDRDWVSDEIHQYPFPSSIRNRYESLDQYPSGLLITGDAIASNNPIHGQGMSVSALEALVMHHTLARGERDLERRFFDRVGSVVDIAWMLSVGADAQFEQTEGPTPWIAGPFTEYVSRLVRAAHSDRQLSEAFYRVLIMEEPPTSLLHPRTIWRVFSPF